MDGWMDYLNDYIAIADSACCQFQSNHLSVNLIFMHSCKKVCWMELGDRELTESSQTANCNVCQVVTALELITTRGLFLTVLPQVWSTEPWSSFSCSINKSQAWSRCILANADKREKDSVIMWNSVINGKLGLILNHYQAIVIPQHIKYLSSNVKLSALQVFLQQPREKLDHGTAKQPSKILKSIGLSKSHIIDCWGNIQAL